MEPNRILSADILDLLFEDRNKAYGAYELRKSYNKRITVALLVTAGLLLFIFLSSFLANKMTATEADLKIDEVELKNVQEEPPPAEPPPPPPPETPPPPKVEMTQFTPPVIKPDEEVKKEEIPPDVDKLEDTKIDVVSQEGVKQDLAVPPVEEKAVVTAPVDNTNYDQTFTKVEVEAEFPGGQGAWTKYLQRNLNAQAPSDAGAPAGSYTVVVKFIVDKEGNISDVQALSSHGYGMEEEAIRAVKRGPKWTPAVQNGRQVKAYRKQPITFVVSEG
jgi:protein TonB